MDGGDDDAALMIDSFCHGLSEMKFMTENGHEHLDDVGVGVVVVVQENDVVGRVGVGQVTDRCLGLGGGGRQGALRRGVVIRCCNEHGSDAGIFSQGRGLQIGGRDRGLIESFWENGGEGGNRTRAYRFCKPVHYHFATSP